MAGLLLLPPAIVAFTIGGYSFANAASLNEGKGGRPLGALLDVALMAGACYVSGTPLQLVDYNDLYLTNFEKVPIINALPAKYRYIPFEVGARAPTILAAYVGAKALLGSPTSAMANAAVVGATVTSTAAVFEAASFFLFRGGTH